MTVSCLRVLFVSLLVIPASLPVLTSAIHDSYKNVIYIDPDKGEDSQDCLSIISFSKPCKNLTWVFQQPHSDSTHYVLSSGVEHYLTQSSPPFQDLTKLAISGGKGGAVVTCTAKETGLAFIRVKEILLSNITLAGCAALRNSTSKNLTAASKGEESVNQFQVGLYFLSCQDINMLWVSVSWSPNATGVVIYNTNGTNTFTHSTFSHNVVLSNNSLTPGGGGVYVEFTYCDPGILNCEAGTTIGEQNQNTTYIFDACEFSHNLADGLNDAKNFTYVFPYKEEHISFGRGGGLSLFLRGNASGIDFTIDACDFHNNTAVWGGGLYLEYNDNVYRSNVVIRDTVFQGNACPFTTTNGTAGGGVRIAHYVYGFHTPPTTALKNFFYIENCSFISNRALEGGGISISWAPQAVLPEQLVHIHINTSYFERNTGKLGGAIHVDQFWMIAGGLIPTILIESCDFHRNNNQYFLFVHDTNKSESYVPPFQIGFGVVCITSSKVWFKERVSFTENKGSAVAVSGGEVSFNGTDALFDSNYARVGAGIYILGASYIVIGKGTNMVFRNNEAILLGGAISVTYISQENLVTDAECFIHHADPTIHPNDWNVTMTFINNREQLRNSYNAIYTTSVLPCSMLGSGVAMDSSGILCWNGWRYYENDTSEDSVNCSQQISTAIGNIEYNGSEAEGNHVKAYPGWSFALPLKLSDDFGLPFEYDPTFFLSVDGSPFNRLSYNMSASVQGYENTTVNLSVTSFYSRAWFARVFVDLLQCPPGFTINNQSCFCYKQESYNGLMVCNDNSQQAKLVQNVWMTLLEDGYYVADCPAHYGKKASGVERILLPKHHSELTEYLCAEGRKGTLCGECIDGFGIAVNSPIFQCINCTEHNLKWDIPLYIGLIYVPQFLFFVLLIILVNCTDFRLTSGPASAFVLHSQIVTTTFGLLGGSLIPLNISRSSQIFIDVFRGIHGIFNLDYFARYIPPFCFSEKLSSLDVLAMEFCVALSPIVPLLITAGILKLCRSQCVNERVRNWCANIKILPVIAAFFMLSYTKISLTSFLMLTTKHLTDKDGNAHYGGDYDMVYMAGHISPHSKEYHIYRNITIAILATFVAIPPFVLSYWPLWIFELLCSKCKRFQMARDKVYSTKTPRTEYSFLDPFHKSYRNKFMRCFAGLNFLFRLGMNISYSFVSMWLMQFLIQQLLCTVMVLLVAICRPYKESFMNSMYIFIFVNLAFVNSTTHYLFEVSRGFTPQYKTAIFIFHSVLLCLPLIVTVGYYIFHSKVVSKRTSKWYNEVKKRFNRLDRLASGTEENEEQGNDLGRIINADGLLED